MIFETDYHFKMIFPFLILCSFLVQYGCDVHLVNIRNKDYIIETEDNPEKKLEPESHSHIKLDEPKSRPGNKLGEPESNPGNVSSGAYLKVKGKGKNLPHDETDKLGHTGNEEQAEESNDREENLSNMDISGNRTSNSKTESR